MITTVQFEGREHFVVPTVMITVGVHSGSRGPVYYSAENLRNSVDLWNGRPVVVWHPELYGSPVSASTPLAFDRQRIGTLFNTRFENNALKSEAWIDPQRVAAIDARVLTAIRKREMMEVSTGLFSQNDTTAGTWNGRPYNQTATKITPDHLAVLPTGVGACSIADGAGLIRNATGIQPLGFPEWDFAIAQ